MASSVNEIAKSYAERVKRSTPHIFESKQASVQKALEKQEIDQLKFESGIPIDHKTAESILIEIDKELNIKNGTFLLLKESSVQSLINFQNLLAQMAKQISYK